MKQRVPNTLQDFINESRKWIQGKSANFIDIGKYIVENNLIKSKEKELSDKEFIKIAQDFLKNSKPVGLTGSFDKDSLLFNKIISNNIFSNNLELSSTVKKGGEVWVKIEGIDKEAYFVYILDYMELLKNIPKNENYININGEIDIDGKRTEIDLNNFKKAQKTIEDKIYK